MRYRLLPLIFIAFAACSNPAGPEFPERWRLDVAASPCWGAFAIEYVVQEDAAGVIGEWYAGGDWSRVVGEYQGGAFLLRFYQMGGGPGADFTGSARTATELRGTFQDPHGAITGGGSCEAEAVAIRH